MKKLSMVILAGMFSAGAAYAQDINFDEMDQDGDGQLSRTEVAQDGNLAANFSRMDADGDGYLSRNEAESSQSQEFQQASEQDSATMGEDYQQTSDTSATSEDWQQTSEDSATMSTEDDYQSVSDDATTTSEDFQQTSTEETTESDTASESGDWR